MAASDVAKALTEKIVATEQARQISAFRVQGVQAILYNRLTQGIVCSCKSHDHQIQKRDPTDGIGGAHQEIGSVNRTHGQATFGIESYGAPEEEFADENFHNEMTSPNDPLAQWLGDQTKSGPDGHGNNLITDQVRVDSNGQNSPDLDSLLAQFDLGSIGLSDASCPICFGSGYIGGFSPFRAWRKVVASTEVVSNSTFDTSSEGLALRAGTHSFTVVFPRGVCLMDVFRPMNGALVIQADIMVDGVSVMNRPLLPFFDGKPHTVQFTTDQPFTHFEMQGATNKEPIYFEMPKRSRNSDISLLEKTDPFQILVSPEVPQIDTLDIIAESQEGKLLVVQSVNNWQTGRNQHLGWEVMVRVVQPAELWRILPIRRYVRNQATVNPVTIAQASSQSGVSPGANNDGQSRRFSF